MDADDSAMKTPVQEQKPEDQIASGKLKQADQQQSDTEPFDAQIEGDKAKKPESSDTERKIEAIGAATAATIAAIFSSVPH